mmetsp:Transcript_21775/g.46068  ORF Transcript_21775/g.46068 Transcript_21775/m.46068 type:complete len:248 (-) Transcript_21775:97-840(-)
MIYSRIYSFCHHPLKTRLAFFYSRNCTMALRAFSYNISPRSFTLNLPMTSTISAQRYASKSVAAITRYHANLSGLDHDEVFKRDIADDEIYSIYESDIDDSCKNATEVMSPNITLEASPASASREQYIDMDPKYDEDYDEFTLHMTPASMTSQDSEQLSELESIGPEEVRWPSNGSSEEIMEGLETRDKTHETMSPSRKDIFYGEKAKDDFVEFEEDWEIMHSRGEKSTETGATFETLENMDEHYDQ